MFASTYEQMSGGTDVFSSLEYNYGHPSQLIVSTVPEPGSIILLMVGISVLGFTGGRQKQNYSEPDNNSN